MKQLIFILIIATIFSCNTETEIKEIQDFSFLNYSENIIDYRVSPKDSVDKSGLMYSDQGAWFSYSLPDTSSDYLGFSGPFLMTQQNGIWSSNSLTHLNLYNDQNVSVFNKESLNFSQKNTSAQLKQTLKNDKLHLTQELVFLSGHTCLQRFRITNISNETISLHPFISGELFDNNISISTEKETIVLTSTKSSAVGYVKILGESISTKSDYFFYNSKFKTLSLNPNETKEYIISQTFIFPEYSWEDEKALIKKSNFDSVLDARKAEKNNELKPLISHKRNKFSDSIYSEVLAKAQLTLQNNWRIPAGEIKHEGLFPSYHYKWFNGFWSWDSWKHAAGLSYYNTELAKKQIKLMFEFQNDDGFVADCVFRDTLIEQHNYRDTKPPLSAWAVSKIFDKDNDLEFVGYMYPKLKKYHEWWYLKRDHDQDGLCEYGSTDGSLIAAKWESGMDNAIRFDNSKILNNSEGAYSLNQESVDLNAYLFAEKIYLSELAKALQKTDDANQFKNEAEELKLKIQSQFYDTIDGWFYDTNLEGNKFIKGEGSEGWTALWAKAATQEQAEGVKNNMLNPEKFYTRVPFQTMSADHEKFNPLKGYWRGPNWLDQAYFGVKGLRNYGFNEEADKATIQILKGTDGVLGKGKSIRENYHPLTGKGLNAQNFSWSAAHIIMLLMKD